MLAEKIISELVQRPIDVLGLNQELSQIAGFDSVMMVRLILAIEAKLDRALEDKEMEAINTVQDVEKLLALG